MKMKLHRRILAVRIATLVKKMKLLILATMIMNIYLPSHNSQSNLLQISHSIII